MWPAADEYTNFKNANKAGLLPNYVQKQKMSRDCILCMVMSGLCSISDANRMIITLNDLGKEKTTYDRMMDRLYATLKRKTHETAEEIVKHVVNFDYQGTFELYDSIAPPPGQPEHQKTGHGRQRQRSRSTRRSPIRSPRKEEDSNTICAKFQVGDCNFKKCRFKHVMGLPSQRDELKKKYPKTFAGKEAVLEKRVKLWGEGKRGADLSK